MKGKSLVGFLVLLTLAAAGRAQTQQTQPPAQTREIEWLVNQGTNYLLARSYASVQLDIKDTCTVAMLHRPKDCAWCDQFNRCLQQTPGLSAPFIAKVDNEVTLARPTLDASTRSSAYHSAYFGPLSFRLSNRVITTYENRGEYQPSNRGIAEVSGEIFFRIPPGVPLDYELSGELQWAGGNSHVQLIGVANTGANSDGFSFNTNHLPKGVPAPLRKAGSLTPGVYRLFWFLTADQISHGGSSGASLDLQMNFESCEIVVGKLPPDPRKGEVTGLFGPYKSPDLAAVAVEPLMRGATDGDPEHREYGVLILKDARDGQFYLTPPVRSTDSDTFNTGHVLLAADYNRSRDLGIGKCKQKNPPFFFFAALHSHPTQQLELPGTSVKLGLSDNAFSPQDFNFAILERHNFDRIYLFPPDRCIRSFKAQRNDPPCRTIYAQCSRYYPRVQPVYNCPRGAAP